MNYYARVGNVAAPFLASCMLLGSSSSARDSLGTFATILAQPPERALLPPRGLGTRLAVLAEVLRRVHAQIDTRQKQTATRGYTTMIDLIIKYYSPRAVPDRESKKQSQKATIFAKVWLGASFWLAVFVTQVFCPKLFDRCRPEHESNKQYSYF